MFVCKWVLQLVLLIGIIWYVTRTTDTETRALEALRFPANEPRPSLAEVNERYTSLSHHLMSFPVVDKREVARVNRAYRYLQKKLGEEEAALERLREALLSATSRRHHSAKPINARGKQRSQRRH